MERDRDGAVVFPAIYSPLQERRILNLVFSDLSETAKEDMQKPQKDLK